MMWNLFGEKEERGKEFIFIFDFEKLDLIFEKRKRHQFWKLIRLDAIVRWKKGKVSMMKNLFEKSERKKRYFDEKFIRERTKTFILFILMTEIHLAKENASDKNNSVSFYDQKNPLKKHNPLLPLDHRRASDFRWNCPLLGGCCRNGRRCVPYICTRSAERTGWERKKSGLQLIFC